MKNARLLCAIALSAGAISQCMVQLCVADEVCVSEEPESFPVICVGAPATSSSAPAELPSTMTATSTSPTACPATSSSPGTSKRTAASPPNA